MGILDNLLAGGIGDVVGQVGKIIDKFHLSEADKKQFQIEMEALLQKRDSEIEQTVREEMGSRERVLVAELSQGDNYTKRARPTVVYVGLGFIFLNYCLPALCAIFGRTFEPVQLPTEFWAAWGGIVATWSIGRSFEKVGMTNRVTQMATGSAPRAGEPGAVG